MADALSLVINYPFYVSVTVMALWLLLHRHGIPPYISAITVVPFTVVAFNGLGMMPRYAKFRLTVVQAANRTGEDG